CNIEIKPLKPKPPRIKPVQLSGASSKRGLFRSLFAKMHHLPTLRANIFGDAENPPRFRPHPLFAT
ncbi:hypothetical protein, partial [Corynebacterium pseudodiphtheriticum]|uniref:hypothetical protein n=1 Tax=Corynebacterium pseudodiphtheriticum TaxID=37637 RepID=UPI00254C8609